MPGGVLAHSAVAWQGLDNRPKYTVEFYRPDRSLVTSFYNSHIKGKPELDVYEMNGGYQTADPRIVNGFSFSIQPIPAKVTFAGATQEEVDGYIDLQKIEIAEYKARYDANVEAMNGKDGINPIEIDNTSDSLGLPDGEVYWGDVFDGSGESVTAYAINQIQLVYTPSNTGTMLARTQSEVRYQGLLESFIRAGTDTSLQVIGGWGALGSDLKPQGVATGQSIGFLETILNRWLSIADFNNAKVNRSLCGIQFLNPNIAVIAPSYPNGEYDSLLNYPISSVSDIVQYMKDVAVLHTAVMNTGIHGLISESQFSAWKDPRYVTLDLEFSGVTIDLSRYYPPEAISIMDDYGLTQGGRVDLLRLWSDCNSKYPPSYTGQQLRYNVTYRNAKTGSESGGLENVCMYGKVGYGTLRNAYSTSPLKEFVTLKAIGETQ